MIRPDNIFKKSSDFEGELRSIKRGAQVRWRKNLCAKCNNTKSQPFDRAYDRFEAYLIEHMDDMMRWEHLDWSEVYGDRWAEESRNLARYFGKQMGCMMATQRLPVPRELIDFLDGAARSPSTCFMLHINWKSGDMHKRMRRLGDEDGLSTFVGLLDAVAYQTEGSFSGITYGFHIGYLCFIGEWHKDSDRSSWFEHQVIQLQRINNRLTDRLGWWGIRIRSSTGSIFHRAKR